MNPRIDQLMRLLIIDVPEKCASKTGKIHYTDSSFVKNQKSNQNHILELKPTIIILLYLKVLITNTTILSL
jgi:hypothetical protein